MFIESNYVRSVCRTISILKSFTTSECKLSGAELARKVGLSVTTVHRLLACLSAGGFVARDNTTLKYSIGPEMYRIGNLFLLSSNLATVAAPIAKSIKDMTNEGVSISILIHDTIMTVLREESEFSLGLHLHIGSLLPAHATSSGKALLCDLTEAEIDNLYPEENLPTRTKKTLSTKTHLKQELELVRAAGIAFCREESYEGVIAIASPIRDTTNKVVASVSISVPIFRINKLKETTYSELISIAAGVISYQLGYQSKYITITNLEGMYSWWHKKKVNSSVEVG